MRRVIYERSVTNIRDWSLAYSFIYSSLVDVHSSCGFSSLYIHHPISPHIFHIYCYIVAIQLSR